MILLLFFFLGCLTILISYGYIKHYYLKDKYEKIITKKFHSIGFQVLSIKSIEKPNFIQERDLNSLELLNTSPMITTYRIVELQNNLNDKFSAYVSIEKILYTKLTIKYFLNDNKEKLFKEII